MSRVSEGLNAKYLGILWSTLNGGDRSPVLDVVRAHWREASAGQTHAVAAEIARWQKALWRFTSVGQIGKVGGPKAWMEPVTPIVARQELRLKMPGLSRAARSRSRLWRATPAMAMNTTSWSGIGPGWSRRDVPTCCSAMCAMSLTSSPSLRERAFGSAAKCLDAAAEASAAEGQVDVAALAKRHGVEPAILAAWLDYLGISTSGAAVKIDTPLTGKITKASGYDFVNGWGSGETPNVVANSSDQHVRIPGNLKPHSVAMHPSPSLARGGRLEEPGQRGAACRGPRAARAPRVR